MASVVLVAFAPLWLAIGAAIVATSPGPALYTRMVVGLRGKPFRYYKFRTMLVGDESHHLNWLRDYVERDAPYEGNHFKVRNDPRITRIGALLRRTSVDEIPQLINVVLGSMSIVGPRPPIEFEYQLYSLEAKRRLAVRPGITGLYQVTARGSASFSQMLAIDLDYIKRRSLHLDAEIMLRTLSVMVTGRGAS